MVVQFRISRQKPDEVMWIMLTTTKSEISLRVNEFLPTAINWNRRAANSSSSSLSVSMRTSRRYINSSRIPRTELGISSSITWKKNVKVCFCLVEYPLHASDSFLLCFCTFSSHFMTPFKRRCPYWTTIYSYDWDAIYLFFPIFCIETSTHLVYDKRPFFSSDRLRYHKSHYTLTSLLFGSPKKGKVQKL